MKSQFTPRELWLGVRFLWKLRPYLRDPLSAETVRTTMCRRLEHRDRDFLSLARSAIYENPASPYLKLLKHSGCEYGDLDRLVAESGVEGALEVLLENGVYLTIDEFKGHHPVRRGELTFAMSPEDAVNPFLAADLFIASGGSRGRRTLIPIDLATVRDGSINVYACLMAQGGIGWSHIVWNIPGTAAIIQVLTFKDAGSVDVDWFSQVDPKDPSLHPRYRWSARTMHWAGRMAGSPMPRPIHVSLEDPGELLRRVEQLLDAGNTPHLWTYPSSGVRLCLAALKQGIDLSGVRFSLAGEPVTEACCEIIGRAGGVVRARYAASEAGLMGYGCLEASVPDDVHVFSDFVALVQPQEHGCRIGLPAGALMISSLRGSAPLVLLNVSLGDEGVLGTGRCTCAFERLGLKTHLHGIRSYEKLTAAGMTFSDHDIVRIIEQILPARFGGAPTDYQLVEETDDRGNLQLRLRVHPSVGPIDHEAIGHAFLQAVGSHTEAARLTELVWRTAGVLRVERQPPLSTRSGKILHLHVRR